MKKKLLSLLLALSMGLTLAACGSGDTQESTPSTDGGSGADAELPVLKVAVMPFLNCLPVQYMIENGLDVANGFQAFLSMNPGAPGALIQFQTSHLVITGQEPIHWTIDGEYGGSETVNVVENCSKALTILRGK